MRTVNRQPCLPCEGLVGPIWIQDTNNTPAPTNQKQIARGTTIPQPKITTQAHHNNTQNQTTRSPSTKMSKQPVTCTMTYLSSNCNNKKFSLITWRDAILRKCNNETHLYYTQTKAQSRTASFRGIPYLNHICLDKPTGGNRKRLSRFEARHENVTKNTRYFC